MRNNYWLDEYSRNYLPYYCPYCQPGFEEFQRFGEGEFGYELMDNTYEKYESPEDILVRYPIYEGCYRDKNAIEKIAKAIYVEISKDLKLIESIPIAKELMVYVIKVIGDYIEKNHEKFLGPIEIKVEGLMKALKKDLYWVFEILELFGVAHETAINFVETVIDKFLREIMMESNEEQSSPMWGIK